MYNFKTRKKMSKLSKMVEAAKARGDKKMTEFSGAVRDPEISGFEKGDEFALPVTFEVYEQSFGNGSGSAQYILVECGPDNFKQFFPSTFSKSRAEYNEDMTPTGKRVRTKGTATELYLQSGSVQAGMEALRATGKKLKITKIEPARTLKYDGSGLQNVQILTIDLV